MLGLQIVGLNFTDTLDMSTDPKNTRSQDVVEMLEKCKADQILNMTLCRSLTYEFLGQIKSRLGSGSDGAAFGSGSIEPRRGLLPCLSLLVPFPDYA